MKEKNNYINIGGGCKTGTINTSCRDVDKLFIMNKIDIEIIKKIFINYKISNNILFQRFQFYETIINIYENREKIINEYNII